MGERRAHARPRSPAYEPLSIGVDLQPCRERMTMRAVEGEREAGGRVAGGHASAWSDLQPDLDDHDAPEVRPRGCTGTHAQIPCSMAEGERRLTAIDDRGQKIDHHRALATRALLAHF